MAPCRGGTAFTSVFAEILRKLGFGCDTVGSFLRILSRRVWRRSSITFVRVLRSLLKRNHPFKYPAKLLKLLHERRRSWDRKEPYAWRRRRSPLRLTWLNLSKNLSIARKQQSYQPANSSSLLLEEPHADEIIAATSSLRKQDREVSYAFKFPQLFLARRWRNRSSLRFPWNKFSKKVSVPGQTHSVQPLWSSSWVLRELHGDEIVVAASSPAKGHAEWAAEMGYMEVGYGIKFSQLFFGPRFASGAHSRIYHGIYDSQDVAIKLTVPPSDDLNLSCQINREFYQEVTLLSRLQHRNIIRLIGACREPGIRCVITEYLPKGSLKVFIRSRGPNSIPVSKVIRMALDVAMGMAYLHSRGVIHRDLKSANLLMTSDLCVKVADFGVSCLESQICMMKDVPGTLRYMAPEMINQDTPSRKVDVYSFGVVLWELCTGLAPFEDMEPVQVAFAISQELTAVLFRVSEHNTDQSKGRGLGGWSLLRGIFLKSPQSEITKPAI
ncbi:hypothetical protein KP509_02G099900 [Ceratopteris richardii]|uniref:Protein kinase domain-containing protein n=1 Tax=Ceratopteris richardii TaxID=49495 RepID=A0A8T2VG33_CERRI|nr:hypothetical protein KP509_02G099900 [Ceratopteris richardii]